MTIVADGERGLVTEFGQTNPIPKEPGLVRVNLYLLFRAPLTARLSQTLQIVDMKTQVFELPYLVCKTRANIKVHLTPVLYYRIVHVMDATFKVASLRHALQEHIQVAIQELLRQKTQEQLATRSTGLRMETIGAVKSAAQGWGIEIEDILFKDFGFEKETPTSNHVDNTPHGVNFNIIETVNHE